MSSKQNKKVPLELIGLLTLAKAHNASLREISAEARRIVGEKEEYGHVSDIIWSEIESMTPEAAAKSLWEKTADERKDA